VDAFRYFLIRDMTLGRDASFSEQNLIQRYQGDLANDLGNLLHRLVNMIERYCEGRVPEPGEPSIEETILRERCQVLPARALGQIKRLALNDALALTLNAVGEINQYLERTAPWGQAKMGRIDRVETILYYATEALRLTSVLLQPVMPERIAELWRRLGWQPPPPLKQGLAWGRLQPETPVVGGPPLFPKDVLE
jgi:methionyl-tRNA synthetase